MMNQLEKELFKFPFEESLRKKIIKLTNPPYNIKRKDLVQKADIHHQTLLDFMSGVKDTKIRALSNLNNVIGDYEIELGLKYN